jgi:hypothetical protein
MISWVGKLLRCGLLTGVHVAYSLLSHILFNPYKCKGIKGMCLKSGRARSDGGREPC